MSVLDFYLNRYPIMRSTSSHVYHHHVIEVHHTTEGGQNKVQDSETKVDKKGEGSSTSEKEEPGSDQTGESQNKVQDEDVKEEVPRDDKGCDHCGGTKSDAPVERFPYRIKTKTHYVCRDCYAKLVRCSLCHGPGGNYGDGFCEIFVCEKCHVLIEDKIKSGASKLLNYLKSSD